MDRPAYVGDRFMHSVDLCEKHAPVFTLAFVQWHLVVGTVVCDVCWNHIKRFKQQPRERSWR